MSISSGSPLPERDPEALWWFGAMRNAMRRVRNATVTRYVGLPVWRRRFSFWDDKYVTDVDQKTRHFYRYDDAVRAARDDYFKVTGDLEAHPAVLAVLQDGWAPTGKSMEHIVLEWPSLSEDGTRLAYFQSDQKIARHLRTVTSPEKYIKARWPYLPDHMIRDFVARTAIQPPLLFHTTQDFVEVVQNGPSSCMVWDDGECGAGEDESWVDLWEHHPYATYDPKYGWRMVARLNPGEGPKYAARALILHSSQGPYTEGESLEGSVYVRTYRHAGKDAWSPADEALESWLRHNGVEKESSWPDGARLACVKLIGSGSRHVFPYIDGDVQTVSDEGDCYAIDENGDCLCNNPDGTAVVSGRYECSACGETHSARDDGIWVGPYAEDWVGPCCENNYLRVRGRRPGHYYVHENNAIQTVEGHWFDSDCLDDNDIVELNNGDFTHQDNAFRCPLDDQWYLDEDGVDTEDEGTVHSSNAWQCAGTGDWWSTNTDPVIVDGDKYHPDEAPDDEDAHDGDEFDKPYDKSEGSMSNELQQPLDLPVLPDPEPTLYFRMRRYPQLVYRLIGDKLTYLCTKTPNDSWDVTCYVAADIRGPDFFPVASPDERVYTHPDTLCLYRAGERHIDVLHPGVSCWVLSCGEDNTWLTDPAYQYKCVSHTFQPELEVA